MTQNILQETLADVFAEFEDSAEGAYGEPLRSLVDGMLGSCEAEMPFIDLEAQFSSFHDDLQKLEDLIRTRMAEKMSTPRP